MQTPSRFLSGVGQGGERATLTGERGSTLQEKDHRSGFVSAHVRFREFRGWRRWARGSRDGVLEKVHALWDPSPGQLWTGSQARFL